MSHVTKSLKHLAPDAILDFSPDFDSLQLNQSKGLYTMQLIQLISPPMMKGFQIMFEQSLKLCHETNEMTKYLQNFQNILGTISKWNPHQVEEETQRIINETHCDYLEDLVTCVHVITLKLMSCIRVASKSKKIELDIPPLANFIHKCYIQTARLFFKNVYLFQIKLPHLKVQENNHLKEQLLEKAILLAVNESIPMDKILRAYMDETMEEEVEVVEEPLPPTPTPTPPPTPPTEVQVQSETETPIPEPPPEPASAIEIEITPIDTPSLPPTPTPTPPTPTPAPVVSFQEENQDPLRIQLGDTLTDADLSIFDEDIEILS